MYKISTFVWIFLLAFPIFAGKEFRGMITGRLFEVDKYGNMYTNEGNHKICKYSPDGNLLVKMGRKGEGPGDIKRLGFFTIHPVTNIVYVTEYTNGNKWISKFSPGGKFLGTWNCDLDWKKWSGLSFIAIDSKKYVYVTAFKLTVRRCKDFRIGSKEISLLKFSPGGKQLKEIHKFRSDSYAEKFRKGNITLPFLNVFRWALYKDMIIIQETQNCFLSVLDTEGNFIKKIPLPFKKEKVTDEDKDRWIKYLKSFDEIRKGLARGYIDLKYWRKYMPFPEFKPIGYGMLIDPDGYIYIRKFVEYGTKEDIWVRIDISGGEHSILKIDKGYFYFRENFVFVSEYDEEEGEYVIIKVGKDEFLNKMIKKQ